MVRTISDGQTDTPIHAYQSDVEVTMFRSPQAGSTKTIDALGLRHVSDS